MDACSRRVLGHAMGKTMDTELFVKAFKQAKELRARVLLQKTIFHSDHFFTM
jgi:transposase InsO family protein